MICRFYRPHSLLQSFVSTIMIYVQQLDRSQPLPVNLFPAIPEHSLYFYPRDPLVVHRGENGLMVTCPPSIIVGLQVGRVNLFLGYDHLVIGVGFRPGGQHRLLRLPLHHLVDYTGNSEDFMGPSIRETTGRLRETTDFGHMNDIIETMLLGWLSKVKPAEHFDGAMQALLKSNGNLPIESLARES